MTDSVLCRCVRFCRVQILSGLDARSSFCNSGVTKLQLRYALIHVSNQYDIERKEDEWQVVQLCHHAAG